MADIFQYKKEDFNNGARCRDCVQGKVHDTWTALCKHYYDKHWITFRQMHGSIAHREMLAESMPAKSYSMSELEASYVGIDEANSRRFKCLDAKCKGKSLSKASVQNHMFTHHGLDHAETKLWLCTQDGNARGTAKAKQVHTRVEQALAGSGAQHAAAPGDPGSSQVDIGTCMSRTFSRDDMDEP